MKSRWQKVATQNIAELFKAAKESPQFASDYAKTIWKTKTKFKAELTKKQKLQFCRKCKTYIPDQELRVRLHNKKMIRTCPNCKSHWRVQYK